MAPRSALGSPGAREPLGQLAEAKGREGVEEAGALAGDEIERAPLVSLGAARAR
jgi:hypothetical protein